jgi:guanine nucleotide-binding protein G(q) subunit alpha
MIEEVDHEEVSAITEGQFQALQGLWADSGIQSCYDRRREFQISDSAK